MPASSIIVRGIPVYKSYYSNEKPTITHATIELKNLDKKVIQVSIRRVTCRAGDDAIPIDRYFLYQLPDYEEKDFKSIEQSPLTTTQYEISFPPILAAPYVNRNIQVEVELELNGETALVSSPYTLSRRTKKGS
jgi:hypothetical protein